jgi:hypothetical protein
MMPVRLAIHLPTPPSRSSSGALDDIRLDKELDEQTQVGAEEPAAEQRSVFGACAIGHLRQEGREAGVVACLGVHTVGS